MKFKSPVFAQASGSIAGITYSRNKGGMYIRARATPTNPNTAAQQAVRAALKSLTSRWSQVLTDAQRTAWAVYAANVPILNKLGEPKNIPALSMYVRCNSPRLQFAGPSSIVDDGPTTMALATFTTPTLSITSGVISVAFDNTNDWATETGGFLFLYLSRDQSPGVMFFKGPFQFAHKVNGANPTAPTSPVTVTDPFGTPTAGNALFLRARASNADGRQSSDVILRAIVA